MRDRAFPWGRAAPTPGQASPPTGSPANGPRTACHPVRGSAGDGVRVQREPATLGPTRHVVPGNRLRSWGREASPDTVVGMWKKTRAAGSYTKRTAPRATAPWSGRAEGLPQQRALISSPRAGHSALSPAPRTRDHASAGRRGRAARRRHESSSLRDRAPRIGAVCHVGGVYRWDEGRSPPQRG